MSDISWLHDYLHLMTYSVLLPSLVDLFCIWLHFLMAYSVHIPPLFTYILYVPPLHDQICTVVTLMANFIYFFLVGFSLHILWLYVHVLLLTYAVHIPPIGTYSVHTEVFKGLFSISPCSIYSVKLFVCTSVIFTSYFVYFVLLGELIFTWHIYYLHVPLVTYSVQKVLFNGLFCTHTPPCWSKIPIYDVFSIFTSPWWVYFYIYNTRMSGDLYTYIILVTYFVHIEIFEGSFCMHTSPWLTILFKYHDLVSTILILVSLSVHWLPIPYIRNFSTAFSVHLSLHVDLKSVNNTYSYLVFN